MNTTLEAYGPISTADEAQRALTRAGEALADAVTVASARLSDVHDMIVAARSVLSVNGIAEAIGRERNYVDSVWSAARRTTPGKQTRINVKDVPGGQAEQAKDSLARLAKLYADAAQEREAVRETRNAIVVAVYRSGVLGPSAIAAAARIDRNHVLRLKTQAGVAPAHRANTRNQYTAKS